MKWPFLPGTRVKINKRGEGRYFPGETNPSCPGTVYDPGYYDTWVHVKWDNGEMNSYEEGTIDTVTLKLENK